MTKKKILNIDGIEISILAQNQTDYISLTDMARSQLQDVVIIKWLSLKNTIEYLGEWEALYNPNFNYTEFGIIKNSAGSNMESINALLIEQGLSQKDRLLQLNKVAISQMKSLLTNKTLKSLKK